MLKQQLHVALIKKQELDHFVSRYCQCKNIRITTPPTKTSYAVNDYFNPDGMVVTLTRQDGTTEVITDYRMNYTTESQFTSTGEKTLTVTYTEARLTYSDSLTLSIS